MRATISFLLILLLFSGYSQSGQAEYLEAKRQFSLGNFSAAKLAFQSLSQDNDFGAYASFYFALSAYKNGEREIAYDMWRQVQVKYPTWDQHTEVKYWLATTAFELKKYAAGFRYLKEVPEPMQQLIINQSFGTLSYEELKTTYLLNQDSEALSMLLSSEMMKLPYGERDLDLLQQLRSRFDVSLSADGLDLPEIRKDQYAVAVVLPFMFDSVESPQTVLRNSIIWDLYQGMQLAKKELESEDILLDLFPYDTKKSAEVSNRLVRSGALVDADVIVGPLYSGPNDVISQYSMDQKITMMNPLSSNEEIVSDNPFSYLFRPSYQTQGKAAAAYAKRNFTENKKAFIFYETDRDSLVARSYLDEIQKDSFFVVRFERMTNESAQQVQKDFTEKYEIRLDTMFSKEKWIPYEVSQAEL